MSYYIDPITELPKHYGEIYSDKNIKITGVARINTTNPNQVITEGVTIYCSPIDGGEPAITEIPNGTYTLSGTGSSFWVRLRRVSGLSSVALGNGIDIYTSGTQPKSRKDYIQIFYQVAAGEIIAAGDLLIAGQRIYDAIVGDLAYSTHSDLQTAINDVPDGSWILVRQMCLINTMITTGGKSLTLVFSGCGTGLMAAGATTGIQLDSPSCQLVGFGTISGFGTGVDLNNQVGSRIEMVFSSNTLNLNFGSLTSEQVNYHGSYGLAENAHIETATVHGAVGRWNDTKKRWEPIADVTINDGSTFQAPIVIGAVYQ
jgi:hypothetical protein